MKPLENAEGTATTATNAAIAIPAESCLNVCCMPNMESSFSVAIAVCDLLPTRPAGG
jgi:hypothetical protein